MDEDFNRRAAQMDEDFNRRAAQMDEDFNRRAAQMDEDFQKAIENPSNTFDEEDYNFFSTPLNTTNNNKPNNSTNKNRPNNQTLNDMRNISQSEITNTINTLEEMRRIQLERAKAFTEDNINSLCGEQKYCKKYVDLLKRFGYSWDDAVTLTKRQKDYKQAIYNIKYTRMDFAPGILEHFEESDIKEISSFEEAKAYLLDMPLTKYSLYEVVYKLSTFHKQTKQQEKDFLKDIVKPQQEGQGKKPFIKPLINYEQKRLQEKHFMKALIKILDNTTEGCPKELDVNNYGLNNFCVITGRKNPILDIELFTSIRSLDEAIRGK
jgi:hypothetical protein